jgi:CRISPR-associated endonuclease/helicase Cas3
VIWFVLLRYYAHSDRDGRSFDDPEANWQLLAVHLGAVARLAEQFAQDAGASGTLVRRARALGLLHDVGKYTPDFQRLLRGEVKRAPHSIFGAALAGFRGGAPDVALAIAGHHGGMPDPTPLRERLEEARAKIDDLWDVAVRDCPELGECLQVTDGLLGRIEGDGLQIDCSTRVLFSCLIDADRIDTAKHSGVEISSAQPLNAGQRLRGVLRMAAERARGVADGPVKSARAEVLEACLAAAGRAGPLFSLTVPTGGAKTLASMAFALRRAELFPDQVRRVIVVIPFLSIIEQNAKVYRDAMGDDAVIEHHSGIWGTEDERDGVYLNPAWRLATENWNAPVIVTTSVRFFEALFSNKPKDLRRMHNVARSVVILDEVQTLPRERVGPILSMMRGLAEDWGTTFVFCTATQPAFEKRGAARDDLRWAPGTLDEIMPEPEKLFAGLRRVEVQWPEPGEKKAWKALAEDVRHDRQALIVVNTRNHALKLFHLLAPAGLHVLHLSNNMCPAHRLERLAEIRRRLDRNEDCIVVSTQLVEAGVDLDFPAVWRSMGPLDSIAQAAGRCDREGRLTKELGRQAGRLVVFQPEEDQMPPGTYREAARITETLAAPGPLSIDDPDIIRAYFDRYYCGALDSDGIEGLRRGLKFKSVADRFAMIDDNSCSVIVPFDEAATKMLNALRFGAPSALGMLRRLQRYTVNLWESDFRKGVTLGAIYRVKEKQEIWACREGFYDEQSGLRLEPGSDRLVV